MTVSEAVGYGVKYLKEKKIDRKIFMPETTPIFDTPVLDVNCILEHTLKKSRTFILSHGDAELSKKQTSVFKNALKKRREGLPVAYITGVKEFYGLDFLVTPDVLIPKPDTELLVEHALKEAAQKFASRENFTADFTAGLAAKPEDRKNSRNAAYRVADVCTGSGCIAVSFLHEAAASGVNAPPIDLAVYASDISKKALSVAKKNAYRILSDNPAAKKAMDFFQGDLLDAFPKEIRFELILSNPPYVPSETVTELLKDGRKEPRVALDGDVMDIRDKDFCDENSCKKDFHDGLAIIRRLIPQAYERLSAGGLFLLEAGEYNVEKAAKLMKSEGFADVKIHKDLSGQLRLAEGRKPF
ncbi:peptide chain release factor N(5)-glutamine methyltransferase [Treponema parvum]|uniref:Release factor glutamine methyltransferase n=1 Tax=Treponema parvum TaxID=138851 RepID=A0A975F1H1_9SPIR|nr:HemK/PrmC family methyltransferase [Treponema parvum]QTQ12648.1 peptide chain release factor N(5)-glutamine methyltransferase [Treponema parvum]QTQ15375.1 peptide chain release factor N(5)-glutamine methyltransferase [Treponema parvum]